jgi:hypothetical protein
MYEWMLGRGLDSLNCGELSFLILRVLATACAELSLLAGTAASAELPLPPLFPLIVQACRTVAPRAKTPPPSPAADPLVLD